jgi:hypothetical protein
VTKELGPVNLQKKEKDASPAPSKPLERKEVEQAL